MRRRPPSEPGFTARSREDAASGQLVSTQTQREEDVEAWTDMVTEGTQADSVSLDHTHAGDHTVSRAALRSLPAAEGHFSTGPPTPECRAAGHRVQEGRGTPPHSACWQSHPAWRWGGGGERNALRNKSVITNLFRQELGKTVAALTAKKVHGCRNISVSCCVHQEKAPRPHDGHQQQQQPNA